VIGSLRGAVVARPSANEVVLEVAGVGYRVTLATAAAARAGQGGDEVFVHVHTHVREDALLLYGFVHEDELRCFEALLGAHGVGPALAMAIVSVLSPAVLSTAVLEDDVDTLCAVPGVGRKTAARLLIDLKHRLTLPDLSAATATAHAGGGDATRPGDARSARREVRAALAELGYAPEEVRAATEGLEDGPVEALLRAALRQLAAR
jgi:Holliday junction DNA helicase RuvA